MENKKLIIIPARKGSKGLPGKNIKLLGFKPLIAYTIEFAKKIAGLEDIICISTDDPEVIKISKELDVEIPFVRPDRLATDDSNTFDVIKHALDFYNESGTKFSTLVLLQPTSPFRTVSDFIVMEKLYLIHNPDMVVSVKISKDNPYFNMFYEDNNGHLAKFIEANNKTFFKRQDTPQAYSYNGSIYLININSFLINGNFNFEKIVKYIMPDERSVDIDTSSDWTLAEFYLKLSNENS